MGHGGHGHQQRGPLLMAAVAALSLHAPLMWQAWRDAGIPPTVTPRGLAVELRQISPPAPAPTESPTQATPPVPMHEPASAPTRPAHRVEADDTNSTRLFPEQTPGASIQLRYPDASLPGGSLSLRWWLRLSREGHVVDLRSDAGADSPAVFVAMAEQTLQDAVFSPSLLGLEALPAQACLEIRFLETDDPNLRVQLRRLDVKLDEKSGAEPCLGTSAALPH